jgi:organic radical activating enzyme
MKDLTCGIVEIFSSLEGEGKFIGTPTLFIRLAGCDVGCKSCDSRQTWSDKCYRKQSVRAVVTKVKALRLKTPSLGRVSITGGEPLLNTTFVVSLCNSLIQYDPSIKINLETSGTKFPPEILLDNIFDMISMDIKTPSSGVILTNEQMLNLKLFSTNSNVYTKAVIANTLDIDFVYLILKDMPINSLCFTPCETNGKFFSTNTIMNYLAKNKIQFNTMDFRIITQQHKLLKYR